MSWIPDVVSSTSVRRGFRSLEYKLSPTRGMVRLREARVCCMLICVVICDVDEAKPGGLLEGAVEESVKAQVSITCVPYVLMILMVCPALRCVAMPCRAGMVVKGEVMAISYGMRGFQDFYGERWRNIERSLCYIYINLRRPKSGWSSPLLKNT